MRSDIKDPNELNRKTTFLYVCTVLFLYIYMMFFYSVYCFFVLTYINRKINQKKKKTVKKSQPLCILQPTIEIETYLTHRRYNFVYPNLDLVSTSFIYIYTCNKKSLKFLRNVCYLICLFQ